MDQSQLPPDLQRAVDFHGHLCPGLLIGYRAAKAGAAALGVGASDDEELVAVVENSSCSVDAFQALLSTTFGKGNLIFKDYGKQVFTLTDRKANQAVRISFAGESLRKRLPDGSVDRAAFINSLLTEPDEKIVKVERVDPQPPPEAVIEVSLACESCGEPVQKSRTVQLNGRTLCQPCAQKEAK